MDEKNRPKQDDGVIEGARRASEITPGADTPQPDPEVAERPTRRTFSAKKKLKILSEIDECTQKGEVGAILRRYGLYSSTVSGWRRQRESGELEGLTPKKRGRKASPKDPKDKVINSQQKEIERLKRKLEKAETIIDIQKKVATLLGVPLNSPENGEND